MAKSEKDKKYYIIPPESIYKGKTYGDFAQDWFNWFISSDPDKRNLGPVVFLRSKVIPRGVSGNNMSGGENEISMAGDSYYTGYKNEPNVKIGPDRLQIYADQAVFVPIIVAYAEASKPYDDWGTLQEYTGLTIDNGDNPPKSKQLSIDGDPIAIESTLDDYRIVTPVFPAIVPDTAYGRSVKDFLEMPLAPGSYPTIVEGYFVLLRFNELGKHLVYSYASAGREVLGPYFSQLLYIVEVQERPNIERIRDEKGVFHDRSLRPHTGVPGFPLARDEKIISETIIEQLKNGELSPSDLKLIGNVLNKMSGFDVVKNYKDFIGGTSIQRGRGKTP
jgi:hypothetical protein